MLRQKSPFPCEDHKTWQSYRGAWIRRGSWTHDTSWQATQESLGSWYSCTFISNLD